MVLKALGHITIDQGGIKVAGQGEELALEPLLWKQRCKEVRAAGTRGGKEA